MTITEKVIFICAIVSAMGPFIAFLLDRKRVTKKEKKWVYIGTNYSMLCVGRKKEILRLKKNIIAKKSTFIHGAAGMGKTTIVQTTIENIKKKSLVRRYDGVVNFCFYTHPTMEQFLNYLCKLFKQNSEEELQLFLSESRFLLVLEGCENLKNNELELLIKFSPTSVFIVMTRDASQFKIFHNKKHDHNKINIEVNPLSLNESIKILLANLENKRKKITPENELILKNIAQRLGCLPIALSLISNDALFKENIREFEKIINSEEYDIGMESSEKENINLLIDRNIGIAMDHKTASLSPDAKDILAFLGCITYCAFPWFSFFDDKKYIYAKEELIKKHLISEINGVGIKITHQLIYNRVKKNRDKLFSNYNSLQAVVGFFLFLFMEGLEKKESEWSNYYRLATSHFLNLQSAMDAYLDLQKEWDNEKIELLIIYGNFLVEIGRGDIGIKIANMLSSVKGLKISSLMKRAIQEINIRCYFSIGDFPQCLKLLQNEYKRIKSSKSYSEKIFFRNQINMANIYLQMGNLDEAQIILDEISTIVSDERYLDYLEVFAELYVKSIIINRIIVEEDKDIEMIKMLLSYIRQNSQDDSLSIFLDLFKSICMLYILRRDFENGINIFSIIIDISTNELGPYSSRIYDLIFEFSDFFKKINMYEQAQYLYSQALILMQRFYEIDHPLIDKAKNELNILSEYFKNNRYDKSNEIIHMDLN